MFNITTTNNVGYNGVSQIPDARCTPPYDAADASPGDKSRTYLHSEVQSPGERKTLFSRKQIDSSKVHQIDDVYTFKDSDLHLSHHIHSNSRLRSPSHRKTDALDKTPPNPADYRSVKQTNGFSPLRNNVIANGIHTSDKINNANSSPPYNCVIKSAACVKQTISSNDLFSNLAMGDRDKQTEMNHTADSVVDTKHSIIRYNVKDLPDGMAVGMGYDKLKVKEELVDVKTEPSSWSAEGRVTTPLFSSSYKLSPTAPPRKKSPGKTTSSPRSRRGRGPALHEALQRITSTTTPTGVRSTTTLAPSSWTSPSSALFDCSSLDAKHQDTLCSNYVQPWLEGVSGCEPGLGRAERLAARRATLRRRTTQLTRFSETRSASYSLHDVIKQQLDKVSTLENSESLRLSPPTLDRVLASRGYTTLLTALDRKKIKGSKLLSPGECITPGCYNAAMACAAFCSKHITSCSDQGLFSSCTAKFSDNTQCKMPVVNITNHLPLCDEHAWKRDNYNKICQESKPKKAPRKRPKPSAMIRPQKRNRKRKKPPQSNHLTSQIKAASVNSVIPALPSTQSSTSSGCEESAEEAGMGLSEEFIEADNNHHIVDEEVVAQVLGLQVEEASRVFNDFFAAEQNEEYIPTREETEELERALEAVNQDVKSLEKLTASESGGLLDTFLDERALAETLASLPDVFSPSPNCTA